jgi:nucleotide-binding universal stress UspA family protein
MPVEPIEPVIVGVDGSPSSMAAIDLGADEALARVAPLVALHVGDGAAADRVVELAVGQARSEHPGLAVSAEVVSGDVAEVLAARSSGACLLVLGHRVRHGSAGLSVAARVMHASQVPVIVYRPLDTSALPHLPRPVLVGVSGPAASEPAVAFAFEEASLRGAPLLAMHVWSVADDVEPDRHPDAHTLAWAHDEADRMLAGTLEVYADKYPDVMVHRAVRHGLDVPVTLTAASRSAQLVVVGSPASPHSGGPVAGSVSDVLIRRAGCPVAAVPAG